MLKSLKNLETQIMIYVAFEKKPYARTNRLKKTGHVNRTALPFPAVCVADAALFRVRRLRWDGLREGRRGGARRGDSLIAYVVTMRVYGWA